MDDFYRIIANAKRRHHTPHGCPEGFGTRSNSGRVLVRESNGKHYSSRLPVKVVEVLREVERDDMLETTSNFGY